MSKSALKARFFRSALHVLHGSGAHRALAPFWGGQGVIFMLHHIKPADEHPGGYSREFHPNGILEITPDFLDAVIERVKELGLEPVSMAEAVARIQHGDGQTRFAVFTIDDGYGDNYHHAWPVFRKHECPFTVFVTTGIIDGTTELWWLALERIIAGNGTVQCRFEGWPLRLDVSSAPLKQAAFDRLYWPLRGLGEMKQRAWIRDFSEANGFDLAGLCAEQRLSWSQIGEMMSDPLVTIGAHTVNHFALARLDAAHARRELHDSRARILEKTGRTPDFFCYPYGDPDSAGLRDFELAREAGFTACVTTRKGVIFPEHRDHLMALPRVSLNGDFQDIKFIDLFVSGAPFAIWNRFRKVHAA